MTQAAVRPRVCFVGAGRFSTPLDATQSKKFALLSRLADVHVVAFAAPSSPTSFTDHAQFHLLRMPASRLLRYAAFTTLGTAQLFKLVWRRQLDVIVAQSPYEALGPVVVQKVAALFGRRVRCVVESHGDFEVALLDYRRVRFAGLYKWLMALCARVTLGSADAVRAVSRSTAAQIERVGKRHDVHVFHTWTDLEAFLDGAPVEKQPDVLVFAGTHVPAKGLHVLLAAVDRVVRRGQAVRLLVVGRAENREYAAEIRDLVARFGLETSVEFHDHMTQAALAAVMRRAQALVLPSTSSEGLPRVILEAMASRTAVITTAIAGAVEVIRDGESGFLVPPGDVDALAERLSEILAAPDRAKAMGEQGRAFVEGRFGAEVYQRGYAQLLADAVGADPSRPMDAHPAMKAS